MDKRKLAVASATTIALASLVAYALIQYYGQVQITVPVEQAVWVDGKRFNETITETLAPTYGGCTVYANHTLENKGDDNAQIRFAVVNVTNSHGNPIPENEVQVYFTVNEQRVATTIVPAHTTIEFEIAIHFHYAIMPDTYTVTVQVEPYVP
jgi:ABC-type transporter MlaC component